jgi:hypothetical protein
MPPLPVVACEGGILSSVPSRSRMAVQVLPSWAISAGIESPTHPPTCVTTYVTHSDQTKTHCKQTQNTPTPLPTHPKPMMWVGGAVALNGTPL